MGRETGIDWCDSSFSPWRGCVKVSAACKSCYADAFSHRNPKSLGVFGTEAQGGTRVVAADNYWKQPIKWNAEGNSKVFCASLSDVFEDWQGNMLDHKGRKLVKHNNGRCGWSAATTSLPSGDQVCGKCGAWVNPVTMDDVRNRLFQLFDDTNNLTWQVLTKRPENIRRMWPRYYYDACMTGDCPHWCKDECSEILHRENVWLGTTTENQEMADKRIPELLKCNDLAKCLFLSCEPLLGPIDLDWVLWTGGVGWAIVGCESGAHRRETKLEWVRDLRDQCKAAGVAFFVKQLEIDGKVTTDLELFPEDLRIREFPATT